ncbi:MAG: hypothetical protein QGI84_11420, partial [Dehalococcoidia bacterium]|nr:hypothetical protein [Dehalococcoidia bacterium]
MSPKKVALVSADNERTQAQLTEFQRLVAEVGPDAEVVWVDSEQPEADLVAELEDTVAILHGYAAKLSVDVLKQVPTVKLVQTMSA